MAADLSQLLTQLSGSGVLGAVAGAVTGTTGKSQIVIVNGRRYRQPTGTNYLIPISRVRRVAFSERSVKAMLAMISTGARLSGGGRGGRRRMSYSFPRSVFRKRR